MRPSGTSCTRYLPTMKRASSTVSTGKSSRLNGMIGSNGCVIGACDDRCCLLDEKRVAKPRNDWLFVAIASQSVVSKQHFRTRLRSKFFQLEYCYIPVTRTALAGLHVPR